MHANHKEYNMIIGISLLVLTLLIMMNLIGQLIIYAASTPTSGYIHGCSDAQIFDHAYRYINQPGMGPKFL
ncbi:MAG: hypothetical protein WBQ25_24170 [Nitrososphaeraceae archaeon]